MKITEYTRINRVWHPIREYYWFTPPDNDDDAENLRPPRRPCEGCGREFSRAFIRAHECLGGNAGYPRLPNSRLKTLARQDPAVLGEYMRTRQHRTVSTD